ncbi:Wzz/FepE/Etk N-terminal domain-containing protein [Mycolicibacterium mengxianglii]|uniref:Wzz/FepE/Etk N-terminal domain-containing protein n=1 Tax=Mycolicibacterium mengxianglii TaxID=2736649 RepID=UPI0018D17B5B|nr:Wzz/FepE/Etk N-terminal domain-containing protein [Mycolicibacterium mengxianglii]
MSTIAATNNLQEPWFTLRRHRLLILLTTILVAAVSYVTANLQPPRYEASADILFEIPVTEPLFLPADAAGGDPVRTLQTEIQLVSSEAVEDAVRRSLHVEDAPEVAVEPVGQSDVIRIIAADRVPANAAAIANAYAASYIEVRKDVATDARGAAERALEAEIAEVGRQIAAINQRIEAAPTDVTSLVQERDALVSQGSTLSIRLREVRIEAAAATGRARVVATATAPASPVAPKPLIAAAVGVAFGLLFGAALAVAIERRNDRRRRAELAFSMGQAADDQERTPAFNEPAGTYPIESLDRARRD